MELYEIKIDRPVAEAPGPAGRTASCGTVARAQIEHRKIVNRFDFMAGRHLHCDFISVHLIRYGLILHRSWIEFTGLKGTKWKIRIRLQR